MANNNNHKSNMDAFMDDVNERAMIFGSVAIAFAAAIYIVEGAIGLGREVVSKAKFEKAKYNGAHAVKVEIRNYNKAKKAAAKAAKKAAAAS